MWSSMSEDCTDCICARSNKSFKINRPPRCTDFQEDPDKENVQQQCSPMKTDGEVSLYEVPSPRSPCRVSPRRPRQLFRRPLEEQDANSMDSGYGVSFGQERCKFFKSSGFHSFESESLPPMDDEYVDFSDMSPLEHEKKLPTDFNKLISQTLIGGKCNTLSPRDIRPPLRRAISVHCDATTPTGTVVRSSLFNIQEDGEIRSFKRSEPPAKPSSPSKIKRTRTFDNDTFVPAVPQSRELSSTEESIKCALQRSLTEPDLIGDFSKTFCLPLTPGRHQDLKSITPKTLAMLMKGCFSSVCSYKVIDCRYPYEYQGGHIVGAVNVYTKEQCMELLNEDNLPRADTGDQKRHILVFHCEFSSERGPNLSRYLRNADRLQNQQSYPRLSYPEVYILDGGYKNFYEQFSELCEPVAYKPMNHPGHEEDLRHFRAKSKTWNCDTRMSSRATSKQTGSKRLKFL